MATMHDYACQDPKTSETSQHLTSTSGTLNSVPQSLDSDMLFMGPQIHSTRTNPMQVKILTIKSLVP